MRLYALTELHDPEAIELFITEEDAERALEDCLRDEPDWRGLLREPQFDLIRTSDRTWRSIDGDGLYEKGIP
jgi:hypothetical protein